MPYLDELSPSDYNAFQQQQQNDWNSMAAAQWSARQNAMRSTPDESPDYLLAQQVAHRYDPTTAPGMRGVPGYMRDYAVTRRGQDIMTGNDPVSLQNNPLFNDPQFHRLPPQYQAQIWERYTGHPLEQSLQASQFGGTWSDVSAAAHRNALQKSVFERQRGWEGSLGYNPLGAAFTRNEKGFVKIPGKSHFNPNTGEYVSEPDRLEFMPEPIYNAIMQDAGTLTNSPVSSFAPHDMPTAVPTEDAERARHQELIKQKATEEAARYAAAHRMTRKGAYADRAAEGQADAARVEAYYEALRAEQERARQNLSTPGSRGKGTWFPPGGANQYFGFEP